MGKETHEIATRPPTEIDTLKIDMERELGKAVVNYFRGDDAEALAFKTAAVDYVRRVPKLLQCNRTSLLTALVTAAQFRFMPSGVGGEAFLIPYGTEAKFQLGYQGVVTLLYRTGKVATITANIICEGDEFDYQEGVDAHLIHKPAMFGKKRGNPIGVYTVVQMTPDLGSAKTFKVMDEAAIMEIKDLSKAKNSKESPWNSDQDPELWMWKKTCLLQHAKLLPKSRDLQQAIEKDYEGSGLDKPKLDAGGPAVGRAFHDPEKVPPTKTAEESQEDEGHVID